MIKKILVMLLVMAVCIFPISTQAEARSKVVKDLERDLKKNFGTLKTKYVTFDLRDSIQVIENGEEDRCFDIAIVMDWTDIESGYYQIIKSIKYTKAQKVAFDKAIESYQKRVANYAMKKMPNKKIRGGFLDYGYHYPNIKADYYEGAVFGWKNYGYAEDNLFPTYYDTKVTKFNWHCFNDLEDPVDVIGLY